MPPPTSPNPAEAAASTTTSPGAAMGTKTTSHIPTAACTARQECADPRNAPLKLFDSETTPQVISVIVNSIYHPNMKGFRRHFAGSLQCSYRIIYFSALCFPSLVRDFKMYIPGDKVCKFSYLRLCAIRIPWML